MVYWRSNLLARTCQRGGETSTALIAAGRGLDTLWRNESWARKMTGSDQRRQSNVTRDTNTYCGGAVARASVVIVAHGSLDII